MLLFFRDNLLRRSYEKTTSFMHTSECQELNNMLDSMNAGDIQLIEQVDRLTR
jgi:DNA invertase Pin-like site-specific DNA recombinase